MYSIAAEMEKGHHPPVPESSREGRGYINYYFLISNKQIVPLSTVVNVMQL